MGFKIIGLWFLLALKAKYLAKYSFLIEVTLLKAGEGFKIAVHHHLDQPIMSIQELDLSPGSVFQVCRCRSSISFLQRIIKGQLISKGVLMYSISSKKRTKELDFTTMIPQIDLFSFVFWRKSKTPKNHFKII